MTQNVLTVLVTLCTIWDCLASFISIQGNIGRFPFTKKFRKFRLGCKWNMIFRFIPLENFRKKRNSWKGSPVFPVETSQWKFVFHLQISRLYHQFHAFRRLSSGQASLVFQQKWRLIRVSFGKLFCKQTFKGILRVLCLPRYSARSGKFIAARMCRM